MAFKISLRGIMLLETKVVGTQTYLNRILMPRAETAADRKNNWKHSDIGKARAHFAGFVMDRNKKKNRWNAQLRDAGYALIGTGDKLLTIDTGVLAGLPHVASHVKDLVLRPESYIEVVVRGAGSVKLGQKSDVSFAFPDNGNMKALSHFNVTLDFTSPPAHALDEITSGFPSFKAQDRAGLYNFDFVDPDPEDLDRMQQYPACADVEDDDDFYWIYGMFANVDGSSVKAEKYPIPKPQCGSGKLEVKTPRVSTCFMGFL